MNRSESLSTVLYQNAPWLKPPVFPGDEDKTRLARVFHSFIVGVAITLVFATVVVLLFGRHKPGSLAFILFAGGMTLLMDQTMRRGHIRLAAGWFVIVAWLFASVFVVLSGKINTAASSLFIPVMAEAALFLGWQASIASAGCALVFLLGIAGLETAGYDLPHWFLLSPIATWSMFTSSGVLTLIPLISMQREQLAALSRAREQLLEREKIEEALRESEAKFRLISSLTSDYTYAVRFNDQGNLEPIVLSGAFETITSYSQDEFLAIGGWRALVHPDDLVQDDLDMAYLRANRRIVSELRIVRKDGGIRWVRTYAHPVWDEARQRIAGINGAVQDITASRFAEQALRESEAKFRSVFELAPFGITIQRQNGEFLAANQAFLDQMGWTAAQILGQNPLELGMLADMTVVEILVPEMIAAGRVMNREVSMKRSDGSPILMLSSSQHIELAGEPVLLTVGVDISERKQAEQALIKSEERYRAISSLISNYAYAHDINPDGSLAPAWMTEESFTRLTGYAWKEIESSFRLYHPDDVHRAEQDVAQTIRGQATSGDYRIFTKTGDLRWIHIDRQVEWDAQHQRPIRLYGAAKDITERQQVEQALRESEKRHRIISQMISDYAYAYDIGPDLSLKMAWVTEDSFTRLSGYTWEEIGFSFNLYHPDDAVLAQQHVEQCLQGQATAGDYRILTKAGDLRWIHLDRQVEWDAQHQRPIRLYGAAKDITERLQTEQQLQEERRLLRDLIDHLPDLVYVKDREGHFRISNTAHTQAVGCWQEEEVQGKTVRDFYAQDLAGAYTRDDQEIFATHGILLNREEPMVNAAGRVRWMLTTKIPLHDHAGEVTGLIGISRDITERKEAEALLQEREDALRQLNAQLEQRVIERTARLEATNRELEAFAYSVSHDLRAPLRSIDGFGLALLEDHAAALDSTGQDYLQRIRSATQRMGSMIDALLTLSRITRAELKMQPLNLSSMAAEVADQLAEADPSRQVEIVIQPNLQAVGDARLLRIALQNLLENAWKYTRPQPQPRLEFSARQQANGSMVFCVSDNGIGFDMAYAGKMFGAFQRLHPQNEFPGHGIGLATVQRIIHRHGGTIWSESQIGQGAAFYFTLETASH